MAKSSSRGTDRRAVVEQMRREQQAKERRQTLTLVGAAVLVAAVIIGVAVWQVTKQTSTDSRGLSAIGVPASAAGCQALTTKKATGNNQHLPVGQHIEYDDAPPAFGPHWGNSLAPGEARTFWTAEDRPPLERLVHSLEHGWTILWYDETVADDSGAVSDLESIADKFHPTASADKLMVAPWTSSDGNGKKFPGGAHVALSHWSRGGTHGNPSGQIGVWRYCDQVSGGAVLKFMEDYPVKDSPEGPLGAF